MIGKVRPVVLTDHSMYPPAYVAVTGTDASVASSATGGSSQPTTSSAAFRNFQSAPSVRPVRVMANRNRVGAVAFFSTKSVLMRRHVFVIDAERFARSQLAPAARHTGVGRFRFRQLPPPVVRQYWRFVMLTYSVRTLRRGYHRLDPPLLM